MAHHVVCVYMWVFARAIIGCCTAAVNPAAMPCSLPDKSVPLSAEQLLQQGTILRNTDWLLGVVVCAWHGRRGARRGSPRVAALREAGARLRRHGERDEAGPEQDEAAREAREDRRVHQPPLGVHIRVPALHCGRAGRRGGHVGGAGQHRVLVPRVRGGARVVRLDHHSHAVSAAELAHDPHQFESARVRRSSLCVCGGGWGWVGSTRTRR